MSISFEETYPTIAQWVQDGWIEIGRDDYSTSLVRALDIGGLVWEGRDTYPTLDAALSDLEAGLRQWMEEHG